MKNRDGAYPIGNPLPFSISKVVIKNFKCFSHFELELGEGMNILVGNNGSGKSTILEAIDLAISGTYRGELINRCLSLSLFNKDVVSEYISSVKNEGSALPPPSIEIELYLRDGDPHDAAQIEGRINSNGVKACGMVFSIAFDQSYRQEYDALLANNGITSLPVEYYCATLRTFADDIISTRRSPLKTAMINPSGDLFGYRAGSRATRILYDSLKEKERAALAQGHRVALEQYDAGDALKEINRILNADNGLGAKGVSLCVNPGTRDSWRNELVLSMGGIPYQDIGSGMQCKILSGVALARSANKGVGVLLVEEPENHLSHSELNSYLDFVDKHSNDRQIVVATHSSFVANKLGLDNITLIGGAGRKARRLTAVNEDTRKYFHKLPGFNTLRFILSRVAVLVEGPSDELVFQRAYMDQHDGKLPIQDGVDVISVGTSFERFLPIAGDLSLNVTVLTDNDDDPDSLNEKYGGYEESESIEVCYEPVAQDAPDGEDGTLRWNTLEATLLRENGIDILNGIFGQKRKKSSTLLKWMESNKTEAALRIFDAPDSIKYPQYIMRALDFVDEKNV